MTQISRRTFIRRMAVGGGTLAWLCTGIEFAHAAGPEAYKLRIIHTNDHHARIEPVTAAHHQRRSTAAYRAAKRDRRHRDGWQPALLDAGDVFQGALWFTQSGHGRPELSSDGLWQAIGNHHDQAHAMHQRRKNYRTERKHWVADPSTPIAGLYKPWIVKEVGGREIGIFGLTTEETPAIASPGPGGVALTISRRRARLLPILRPRASTRSSR